MESHLSMNKGISIVICCYNSAWVICRTLEALKEQRFSEPVPFEVILVDNCCTDETVEIANKTMHGCDIDFRIVEECIPGLANARRRGINEAKYEYVVYCDDDNILCSDYVSTMASILDNNPNVGAAGGRSIAEFCAEPAEIVKEHLECYAVGSQLGHVDWLWGAGLALRTAMVRDIYDNQKCYMIGRKGSELLSGDDSELVMSVVLRGYKVFATDDIYLTHVLNANRLTEEYFHRLYKGLTIPGPAFGIMHAVIDGTKYKDAVKDYIYWYKRLFKYSLLRWKPNADLKAKMAYDNLESFRYWGFLRLYRIYYQWKKIKNAMAQQ